MLFEVSELDPKEREVIGRIDEMRRRLGAQARHPRRWVGALRRTTFARAIQGSNSIEGYAVSLEDAVAVASDEEPVEAAEETRRVVIGYRNAMTYILQLADDPHFAYSEQLLRALHFMMLGYDLSKHPGRWRPGWVGVRSSASGEVVYDAPDVALVPDLVGELIDALNADSDLPPLIRAAMAHLNLAMIHPFSDGNGRMARALQTLVLAREGILEPTFCSIEEYLGRNAQAYYDILAEVGQGAWHPANNARPWVRFCLVAHFRQAGTNLRRMGEMERVAADLEKLIEHHGLPARTMMALFDAAMGIRVRNGTYRPVAEVSMAVASRDLKLLADSGLLVASGERRGRFYRGSPELLALRERHRRWRRIEDPFAEPGLALPGILAD